MLKFSEKKEIGKRKETKDTPANRNGKLIRKIAVLLLAGALLASAWNLILLLIAAIGALVNIMRKGYPPQMRRVMEIILGKERPPKQAKR